MSLYHRCPFTTNSFIYGGGISSCFEKMSPDQRGPPIGMSLEDRLHCRSINQYIFMRMRIINKYKWLPHLEPPKPPHLLLRLYVPVLSRSISIVEPYNSSIVHIFTQIYLRLFPSCQQICSCGPLDNSSMYVHTELLHHKTHVKFTTKNLIIHQLYTSYEYVIEQMPIR